MNKNIDLLLNNHPECPAKLTTKPDVSKEQSLFSKKNLLNDVTITKLAGIVAYDGTRYAGWQEQEVQRTVAGALQHSFQDVFSQPIKVLGASRTDAGVHARHQVFRFHTDLTIAPSQMLTVWSRRIPADIQLIQLGVAHEDFHPHRNIANKRYEYRLFTQRPSPFEQKYGWHLQSPLDMDKLVRALNCYIGTHDFRSFCTGDDMKSTIRTITNISLTQEQGTILVTVEGPSFLRYMVRRLVGSAVTIASKKNLTEHDLQRVLLACNPQHNLITAPAQGLTLAHIEYTTSTFK